MVSRIAAGSFALDSISSVAPTRSRSCRPPARSRNSTAAASVEATTAPTRKPVVGSNCNSQLAAKPVSTALSSTPTVASSIVGASTRRTVAKRVRRPPSNRMIASASEPSS
jgi:hypothetical protein